MADEAKTGLRPTGRQVASSFAYGMNAEQDAVVKKIQQTVRSSPFSIGAFCQASGGDADHCLEVFPQLVDLGVLRCPVNDGGCSLFQLVPEFTPAATRA